MNETAVVLENEHILIHRIQQGDRQAFAPLVDAYWDRLYRWLYHLTHHRQQAEDLAQGAFLSALAKISSFQTGRSFQAWLFRIAHNSFLNQKREGRKIRQSLPEEVPCWRDGPVASAMTRESMQILTRAVGRLPTDYRAAFLLRVEQEMSFQEIAAILSTSEENARWRVFKARQKLMEILTPQLERDQL